MVSGDAGRPARALPGEADGEREAESASDGDGDGVAIRALMAGDEAHWRQLFSAYAAFYAVPVQGDGLDRTWAWLMHAQGPLMGWVAVVQGQAVGLVHCRHVPESLSGHHSLFLDDLFVQEAQRGRGLGERLIGAVLAHAKAQRLHPVRWITAQDNARARRLYDRLAAPTCWVTYEA